jgi:uncharacterized protein YeaO (DUF488 family)
MLYTASFFEVDRHHGQCFSISRYAPRGYQDWPELKFLAPSAQLLSDWDAELIDEKEYTQRYYAELAPNFETQIKPWLLGLDPAVDLTLCCYERSNAEGRKKFCHRNLVASIARKHRHEIFGGCDIKAAPPPPRNQFDPELCRGKRYTYGGASKELKKQFAGVLLEIVLNNDGCINCLGSNGNYYQSVPNLIEVPKSKWHLYQQEAKLG